MQRSELAGSKKCKHYEADHGSGEDQRGNSDYLRPIDPSHSRTVSRAGVCRLIQINKKARPEYPGRAFCMLDAGLPGGSYATARFPTPERQVGFLLASRTRRQSSASIAFRSSAPRRNRHFRLASEQNGTVAEPQPLHTRSITVPALAATGD
jgi:hypothetical protein